MAMLSDLNLDHRGWLVRERAEGALGLQVRRGYERCLGCCHLYNDHQSVEILKKCLHYKYNLIDKQ